MGIFEGASRAYAACCGWPMHHVDTGCGLIRRRNRLTSSTEKVGTDLQRTHVLQLACVSPKAVSEWRASGSSENTRTVVADTAQRDHRVGVTRV